MSSLASAHAPSQQLAQRRRSQYGCSCSPHVACAQLRCPPALPQAAGQRAAMTSHCQWSWRSSAVPATGGGRCAPGRCGIGNARSRAGRRGALGVQAAAGLAPGAVLGQEAGRGVLVATVGATFKLFVACGLVGWLLQTGRISDDAAPVLSKVAFNLLLPCMLFTKVASTLAGGLSWTFATIPLLALAQVAIGAAGGVAVNALIDRQSAPRLGWHPTNPARSAKAIAMSAAAAAGLPQAAPLLLPRRERAQRGTRELVAACCAFGNTFTLPLVFMMSLLPGAAFARATGYTALFLVGWSPLLWSVGLAALAGAAPPGAEDQQGPLHSFDEADMSTAQMALLAPAGAPQAGAPQLAARRRLSAVKQRLEKVLNPPLVAIIAGILVGASPLGVPLFSAAPAASAATARFPLELALCIGVAKQATEMLTLLASGSIAVQTIVLAASLFQQVPEPAAEAQPGGGVLALPDGQGSFASNWARASASRPGPQAAEPAGQPGAERAQWSPSPQLDLPRQPPRPAPPAARRPQQLLGLLLPSSLLEWQMIAAVAAVRFALVPAASLALVSACVRWRLLPADPVCWLVLLIQAAMPPAQNLAVLVNLRPSTRFLAPRLAKLLLRLYVLAVVPVTLWISVWVGCMPVPLQQL